MLFDIIKNKRVALVGPSSSLDNKNMGEIIDSYDIVIKINRFQDLLTKDCGKRMDILFSTFYLFTPHSSIKNYNTKLIVGGHCFNGFPHNKRYFKKSKSVNSTINHEHYPNEELSSEIQNFKKRGRRKTTGFHVITLLLDNIDIIQELNIFGIDFCFRRYNLKYNRKNITPTHNMSSELSLFKELFQKYKDNKKLIIHDKEFLNYLNK